MNKFAIELTEEERLLVSRIDLRLGQTKHDDAHAAFLANQAPILALLGLFDARNAVPEHRIRYWTDPDYNVTGRVRTPRKGLFERNGCLGDDIYTHPHFLPYLRYFLFGAELPSSAIEEFEAKVGEPKWVSLSDAIPLGKAARQIVRQHALAHHAASEEYFKLCLDLGLSLSVADTVLRAVRRSS